MAVYLSNYRHKKTPSTDNRHLHIYKCKNVGSLTVVAMSVNVGDFVGKNVGKQDRK